VASPVSRAWPGYPGAMRVPGCVSRHRHGQSAGRTAAPAARHRPPRGVPRSPRCAQDRLSRDGQRADSRPRPGPRLDHGIGAARGRPVCRTSTGARRGSGTPSRGRAFPC
jgi:hypothetical protein